MQFIRFRSDNDGSGVAALALGTVVVSVIPVILVHFNAAAAPLFFSAASRLVVGFCCLLLLFGGSGFRLGRWFAALRQVWGWPLSLMFLGGFDLVCWVASLNYLEPALPLIIVESWPGLAMLALGLFPATRGQYPAPLRVCGLLALLGWFGVALAVLGQVGSWQSAWGGVGLALLPGLGLALLGCFFSTGSLLGGVFLILAPRDFGDARGWRADFRRVLAGLSISQLSFGVFALGLSRVWGEPVGVELVFGVGVQGLVMLVGMVCFRIGLGSIRNLSWAVVCYFVPVLGTLGLWLTFGVAVGSWPVFLLGLVLVVAANVGAGLSGTLLAARRRFPAVVRSNPG